MHTLYRYRTIQDRIQEIKNVLRNQINVSLIPTGVSRYLMYLTREEMKDICG